METTYVNGQTARDMFKTCMMQITCSSKSFNTADVYPGAILSVHPGSEARIKREMLMTYVIKSKNGICTMIVPRRTVGIAFPGETEISTDTPMMKERVEKALGLDFQVIGVVPIRKEAIVVQLQLFNSGNPAAKKSIHSAWMVSTTNPPPRVNLQKEGLTRIIIFLKQKAVELHIMQNFKDFVDELGVKLANADEDVDKKEMHSLTFLIFAELSEVFRILTEQNKMLIQTWEETNYQD